jgi:hypothetical protein
MRIVACTADVIECTRTHLAAHPFTEWPARPTRHLRAGPLARALYLGTLTESVAGAPVPLLCTRRPDYGRREASTPT